MSVEGRILGGFLAVLGAVAMVGCSFGMSARVQFSNEFNCAYDKTTAIEEEGHYVVTGCGDEAAYHCYPIPGSGTSCNRWEDYPGQSSPARQVGQHSLESARLKSEVQVERKGDASVVVLELVLDGKALLRLTAAPDKQPDAIQLKLIRREPDHNADACSMDWMISGKIMTTPAAVAARDGDVLSHRVQFDRPLVEDLAGSKRVALRICHEHWALTLAQVGKVHDFINRIATEKAWQKPAPEAATAAAPAAGVPSSSPAPPPPPADALAP